MQVLLLIRQMEATANQATASKVSLLMLGHQAIMDAHLCLLHLTTGVQMRICATEQNLQPSNAAHVV